MDLHYVIINKNNMNYIMTLNSITFKVLIYLKRQPSFKHRGRCPLYKQTLNLSISLRSGNALQMKTTAADFGL